MWKQVLLTHYLLTNLNNKRRLSHVNNFIKVQSLLINGSHCYVMNSELERCLTYESQDLTFVGQYEFG